MNSKKYEVVLYGISGYLSVIDKVVNDIGANECKFDIQLILTEVLSNAFKHGNKGDETKPIELKYFKDEEWFWFEVRDAGRNIGNINIPTTIEENSLLENSGRGLFLINCLSDEIIVKDEVLIIKKKI